jgi:succinoglycan biosynthesis transport protein ExoP
MMVATLFGLLAGVGVAYLLEMLNAGFTSPRQVEELLELPLLASISRMSSRELMVDGKAVGVPLMPILKPLSRLSESFRALRSGVQMTDVDNPPKVIQITSTVPGEGKSTTAMAMAASAAQAGLKVVLIDADLRHPSTSKFFGLGGQPGVVEFLLGDIELKAALKYQDQARFWVFPAGGKTQNPPDLLGSDRFIKTVQQLRANFDMVIIDTPPMGPVIDPTVVAQNVDKVVFVVRWASTTREMVQRAVQQLAGERKIAGVVFNQVDDAKAKKYGGSGHAYYYGGSYYRKYYTE